MNTRLPRLVALLSGFALLAGGCAGQHTAVNRQELAGTLQSLKAAEAAEKKGTITGNLYLLHPAVPSLVRGQPVTLLPLSPGLEAAIRENGDRFRKNREPLSPDALAAARRLLDDAVKATKDLGHEGLVRTDSTEMKEAGFTFSNVPEGRWLLTAAFDGAYSVLLWATPVSVEAGHNTLQRLNDGNVWLEGLKP